MVAEGQLSVALFEFIRPGVGCQAEDGAGLFDVHGLPIPSRRKALGASGSFVTPTPCSLSDSRPWRTNSSWVIFGLMPAQYSRESSQLEASSRLPRKYGQARQTSGRA